MRKAKRKLAALLVLAMVFALLPTLAPTAQAGSHSDTDIVYPVTGGNLYFDKATGTITDCDDSVTEAILPAQINGTAVTSIGIDAFRDCTSLQSVEIPNSVTEIGWYAFRNCTSLQSVEIPNSVTEIGWFAFYGCTSLQSIEIPNSVTQIGYSAFEGCTSLQSVEIPNSVTQIGGAAFSRCTSLQSVEIPNSVTSIGYTAFVGCTSLQSVTIPNSVTEIGDYAFLDCTSLQSVEIPNSVTWIDDFAFSKCTSLQSIEIPNSVTKIGGWAFANCTSLKAVLFLGNAPSLGESAFQAWNDTAEKYQNIPGLTLYYIEGKEGWTTPTWNDYPVKVWKCAEMGHVYREGRCEVCGAKDPDFKPIEFTDVNDSNWFAGAVKYVVSHNLFNGTGDGTTFSPNMAMSRAMLVTVLHRQAGTPASSGENVFSDVPNTSWYTKAVLWASENGIVTGSNGKFMPNDAVTREQISVILFRYTQKQGKDTSSRADLAAFPDGNLVSGWAKDAMQWAVAEKLISGNTKGELMPKGEASRAQVATILMRYIENILQ